MSEVASYQFVGVVVDCWVDPVFDFEDWDGQGADSSLKLGFRNESF